MRTAANEARRTARWRATNVAHVARQTVREPRDGSLHPLSRLSYDFAEIMTGWCDASDGGGDRGPLDRFADNLFRTTHWA